MTIWGYKFNTIFSMMKLLAQFWFRAKESSALLSMLSGFVERAMSTSSVIQHLFHERKQR